MAEHSNAELFRRGYNAFQAGDLETVRSLFAPDIVWNVPGNGRFAGTFRGVDDVINLFVQQFQETDGTFKVDVHDILGNDEHAVALASVSAERAGKRVNDRYTHVVHIVDGKVTESWIFDENPAAIDEFWA
jgi:ketosteroid isomerase-like protein